MELNQSEFKLLHTVTSETKRLRMAVELMRDHHQHVNAWGELVLRIPHETLKKHFSKAMEIVTKADKATTLLYSTTEFKNAYCVLLKTVVDLGETISDFETAYKKHAIVMDLENVPELLPYRHYTAIRLLEDCKKKVQPLSNETLLNEHIHDLFYSVGYLSDEALFDLCSFVQNKPILTYDQVEAGYASHVDTPQRALLAAVLHYSQNRFPAAAQKAQLAENTFGIEEFEHCVKFLEDILGF